MLEHTQSKRRRKKGFLARYCCFGSSGTEKQQPKAPASPQRDQVAQVSASADDSSPAAAEAQAAVATLWHRGEATFEVKIRWHVARCSMPKYRVTWAGGLQVRSGLQPHAPVLRVMAAGTIFAVQRQLHADREGALRVQVSIAHFPNYRSGDTPH